jgi:hypothetical protein
MLSNFARIGLRNAFLNITLSCVFLLGASGVGRAQTTYTINCTSSASALQTAAAVAAVTFVSVPVASTVQILGTCVGDVAINQAISAGAIIEPHPSGGHIQGSLTISVPNVTISNLLIDGTGASGPAIQLTGRATGIVLNDVTLQNSPSHGISIGSGSMVVNGGLIAANADCGLSVFNSGMAWLKGNVEITGNGTGAASTTQCGVDVENGATIAINAANIHDNLGGSALRIFMAMADVTGGTFQSPASVTYPTIAIERGSLGLTGATVSGTGQSSAVFASPGSTIKMQNSTLSQSDTKNPTILIADGSALLSVGGNTITNSAANGQAMIVANAGTFHQRNEASMGIPLVADTINGNATVQVQSNMELGSGAGAASTWNGNILVEQNSSFRMDGGMTISGTLQILQGSNAFFNKSATGLNVVGGGVTCPGTVSASHVAAPANVVLADGHTGAVTVGATPPACASF